MLEAELLELKAVSEKMARGTIIEAKLDKEEGPLPLFWCKREPSVKGIPS